MKAKILCSLTVAVLLFPAFPSVFAEDITNEVQNVRRETGSVKQAARTAVKSEERAKTEKYQTGVTYEEVLKDPDNIDLNVRFAQDQIARGEVLGAAATLERILLVNPNLADVRLLYAVVLYRLDSLKEAQKELNTVKALNPPPAILEQISAYEKKIKSRQRRTHFALRESVGWGYDTNRNASPHSKTQLFFDNALPVQGTNVRRADTHFLNVASVDVTHDLGFQAGHNVFANFTHFFQDQTNVSSLDLGSFQYELGGTYKNKYVNFTPSFVYTYLFLSSESFLRGQAWNFLFDHDFTRKLNGFYDFRVERQDFLNITENSDSYNRKGLQFDHIWGLNYMISPTMKWTPSVGYSKKDAKQNYYAYDRVSLNNAHTWIWPKGQFVINALSAYFDRYQSPEFPVSSMHRHDDSIRYRVTYGAPLETLLIGKILPKPFKDVILTVSYEYNHALSSITNYTYTNNKMEGLLTKRLEF